MSQTEQIKLFLVDDDESAIQSIKNTIKYNFDNIKIIGEARNVRDAIVEIDKIKPELLLLDIQLPDGYGFDILESVLYKDFEVIITSSYPNYAVRAYDFSALHFLQKPITLSNFQTAIGRYKHYNTFENLESKITIAKQILNDKYENIMLPMDNGLVKFNLDEIIYFEADSNYSMVHFTNRTKSLISRSLQIIESALLNTQFCRVQSKYLINLRHIKSYHKGKNPYIVLKNDVMIPISLNKREEFLGKLDLIAKII